MKSKLSLKDKLFYGWVVVGAFFIAGISLYGIPTSFGVFFESIESAFHLNRTETSAVCRAAARWCMCFFCWLGLRQVWTENYPPLNGSVYWFEPVTDQPDQLLVAVIPNLQPVTSYGNWCHICSVNVNSLQMV